MSNFTIDFFELMFLAEACTPPRPIARTMFWINLCDTYYHQMNQNERDKAFEWMKEKLNLEESLCQLFYARFNPKNQYLVRTEFEGHQEDVDCFRQDDLYYKNSKTFVDEKYILSVTSKYL